MLCGLICGGDPEPERRWLEQLLSRPGAPVEPDQGPVQAEPPSDDLRLALEALARETLAPLQGQERRLDILLPDESCSLAERATALYDWVRGFLFSLGILGLSERDLTGQSREVLRDFATLTHLDLTDLGEGEDNEAALTELIEFCWVAALLIFEERAATRPGAP